MVFRDPKKKKKKKKKSKRHKSQEPAQEEDDDTLSAFGITPSEKPSRYKMSAGLSRVKEHDHPKKKKKVRKVRRVKKVIKKKRHEEKGPEDNVHEAPKEKAPEVKEKIAPPKDDEVEDLPDGAQDGALGTAEVKEIDEDDSLAEADNILDDLDLDKLTENIEADLLETFENRIDNILGDIIDDASDVENLVEDHEEPVLKAEEKKKGTDDLLDELDEFIGDDEKDEVESRTEIKLESDQEQSEKDGPIVDEVVLEKEENKMISVEKEKKDERTSKTTPKPEAIRIDEGDVRERRVAFKVAHNFEKLPPNMRNELLKTLSKVDDPRVREDVVSAITAHFKSLPPEVQGLLTNLARDTVTRVREEVVFEIQRNFSKINTKVRERILKALARDEEPSVREEVVSTICQYYKDLSADVKDLLKNLAKDKVRSVRDELSFEMAKSDSPVPKDIKKTVQAILKGEK